MTKIESETAAIFPFKKDGVPQFRKNQDRIISESVHDLTEADFKAVAIDAPVGSGKSVVNYTIAKQLGRAVYITAQKSLQDQLDDDDLPGVRSVKGRNAYRCNLSASKGFEDCDCALRNHRDLAFKTCRNSQGLQYQPGPNAAHEIITWVQRTLELGKDLSKHELRRRSSFRSKEEALSILDRCGEIDAAAVKGPAEVFVRGCGCVVQPMECPVKSARFIANNFSEIAVLNPDAYYLLKKVAGCFEDRRVMIVDEAHRLDQAVQRMFRIEVPVAAFENATGISLCDVVEATGSEEVAVAMLEILNTRLLPIIAAGTVLERVIEKAQKSEAGAAAVMEAADAAFRGDATTSDYREQFENTCVGFNIDKATVLRLPGMFPGLTDQETIKHVVAIKEALQDDAVVLKLMLELKRGSTRVFVKDQKQVPAKTAVSSYTAVIDNDLHGDEDVDVIEFVPLHIGAILQRLFFNGIDKIVLSSGTWPEMKSMLMDYGFGGTRINKHCAEPVFAPENRKVYVCNDIGYTDFSEKVYSGKGYVWQTPEGAKKFCSELHTVIAGIRKRLGSKTNIAVHTFSHAVTDVLAQNIFSADSNMLIHLNRRQRNRNGFVFERQDKEALIRCFCNNPGTGLTLISPSIVEGLDFKYDICRAQIILKAPIPNLGDTYIKNKFGGCAELGLPPNRSFLDRLCAIDLNQTYGRVVRAEDDWGETYIMDMALCKRLANAFDVVIPGFNGNAPGCMKKMDLLYFKQGVRIESDGYVKRFIWPV